MNESYWSDGPLPVTSTTPGWSVSNGNDQPAGLVQRIIEQVRPQGGPFPMVMINQQVWSNGS